MSLGDLFTPHTTLLPVIEAVLEGRLGNVVTSGGGRGARLDLGCYAVFGGEASEELLTGVRGPLELLLPDQAWRDRAVEVHGPRLSDRPMRTFVPDALDRSHLETMAEAVPAGFTVERLDAVTAAQLDDDIAPHALQVFPDAADFAARGLGFGTFRSGRLVAAASSYAISSRRVEVAVATREASRRRGLARATAARMVAHCLETGLSPEWSAANPASQRLALALGYRLGPLCDVIFLAS